MRIGVVVFCLASSALTLKADAPLTLRVTPVVAFAPAFVRVQAMFDRDADNRMLRIVAQSGDFYRSSEIEIHGANSPRVQVIEFPSLPSGNYEVSAMLIGTQGKRAWAVTQIRVAPSASGG
jgi:hypothetical protein